MTLMMKRFVDIIVSVISLLLLAPFGLMVFFAVWLLLGSPVLFYQTRPGLYGKPFQIRKFRTMTDARDIDNMLLPDTKRLTRFGRFLRSTSLDELPALWNVLKGDMSLVGPRPLLVQYLPRYSKEQFRRHEVRPGITGWAQVNGRNSISWEEKFTLDVWYVDNRTMALDVKIILLTIAAVLARKDISAQGEPTMPEFMGTDKD